MPVQRIRPRYLDVPFVALAHRGGFTHEVPAEFENSFRAFSSAWDAGYRYLETDIHLTRDGVLVAFHDGLLDRVTDSVGRISDVSWAELASVRIAGTEPIPRFDELLAAFPHARFNIDLKAPGVILPLVNVLRFQNAWDRVCVGSFDISRVQAFRALTSGRVATSAHPLEVAVMGLVPGLRSIWPLKGQVFQVPERDPKSGLRIVSRNMIRAAHRRGADVHVWTVNHRADMERLIDWGVDGLITDNTATLKDVLLKRNLWEGNA